MEIEIRDKSSDYWVLVLSMQVPQDIILEIQMWLIMLFVFH